MSGLLGGLFSGGPGSGSGPSGGLDPQQVLTNLSQAIQRNKASQQGFFSQLVPLNKQINDKINEINTTISAKIVSIQQTVQSINSQIGDFTNQITNNDQIINSITDQIAKLRQQISDLVQELNNQKGQNTSIADEIISKTDQIKLLQTNLIDLQQENGRLKQQIASTNASTTDLQNQLADLTTQYNNVLQTVKQITDALNNDNDFNNSSREEVTERQNLLNSLNQMSQNFLAQLHTIETEVNAINDQVRNVNIKRRGASSLSSSSGAGSFSNYSSTASGNTGSMAYLNRNTNLQLQPQQNIPIVPVNPTLPQLLIYLSQVQTQNNFDQVTKSPNFWNLPFRLLQGKEVKILGGSDQSESYTITSVPTGVSNLNFNLQNTNNKLNNLPDVPFQHINWTEAANTIKSGGKRRTKTKKTKKRQYKYKYNKTAANKKRIKIYRGGFTYTTTTNNNSNTNTNPTTNPTTTNPITTTQERRKKTRKIKVKKSSHNILGRTTGRGLRRL